MLDISILLVEDEEIIRIYLQRILKNLAREVFIASNGKDGLKIYQKNSIDIIISDLNMPIMDGIKMSKEIRKVDKDIPIIILTAHHEEDMIIKAINDGGINKYLFKPLDTDSLKNIIKELEKNIKRVLKPSDILSSAEKESLLEGFN